MKKKGATRRQERPKSGLDKSRLETHISRPEFKPGDDSPVAPSLPRPRTPVVELLILRAFGADPMADTELPLPVTGGLVAERTDVVFVGTEAGTGAVGAAAGKDARGGFGDAADNDSKSTISY